MVVSVAAHPPPKTVIWSFIKVLVYRTVLLLRTAFHLIIFFVLLK